MLLVNLFNILSRYSQNLSSELVKGHPNNEESTMFIYQNDPHFKDINNINSPQASDTLVKSYLLCSPSIVSLPSITYFHFYFIDPIETWMEDSFSKRFPMYSNGNVSQTVNSMIDIYSYTFSKQLVTSTIFHINHLDFHDRIEVWLENSFLAKFPVNNFPLLYLLGIFVNNRFNFSFDSLSFIYFCN
jgi:hypothetical protein